MSLEQVYHENEMQYRFKNIEAFFRFASEYFKVSSFGDINSFFPVKDNYEQVIEGFYYLRYLVLNYEKDHIKYFFELLSQYGYFIGQEFFDMLKLVGNEEDFTFEEDKIRFMLKSPFIQDVKIDGEEVCVSSERFGEFRVISAKNYFNDNINAQSLFSYGDVSRICHTLSSTLLHEVEESKIITSLLPSYFEGTYYHSYLKDNEGMIIDGANRIVLRQNDFERILKPRKVIEFSRYELYEEYKKMLANKIIDESTEFSLPLAVALSKQLLLGGKR